MSATFIKPLTVGKTDDYTYTVNPTWLKGAAIISHQIVIDGKVTLNNSGVTGSVIGASLTGVSKGVSEIHFEYVTSDSRSDCAKTYLSVIEECQ